MGCWYIQFDGVSVIVEFGSLGCVGEDECGEPVFVADVWCFGGGDFCVGGLGSAA